MCRRCNLRLLTLIHVPPKEATAAAAAVEENSEEETQRDEKNLRSTPFTLGSSVQGSQISRVPGDTSDKVEEADIVNYSEHEKPRKPHRDLHVSWRKGHGDFIDHLMFGWHH